MQSFDIKLIKWGLIFFAESATLKTDSKSLEIVRNDGTKPFSSTWGDLKRVNLNTNNGMWTLKSNDNQKCNIVIKDNDAGEKFAEIVDKTGVKGFAI